MLTDLRHPVEAKQQLLHRELREPRMRLECLVQVLDVGVGPSSNRQTDSVVLEFSLVLQSGRFALDPHAARVTWTILVFLGAIALTYAVRQVLFLVALSLLFADLLFPLVRLAQPWVRDSRPLAIAVVYLMVLAVLGGAGIAVGPRLASKVQELAQKLPETSRRIQNGEIVVALLASGGWESRQIREIDRLVQSHMGEMIDRYLVARQAERDAPPPWTKIE